MSTVFFIFLPGARGYGGKSPRAGYIFAKHAKYCIQIPAK